MRNCPECGSYMITFGNTKRQKSKEQYRIIRFFKCTHCGFLERTVREIKFYNHPKHKWKDWIINNFGQTCEICGYNQSFRAIEFHHIDPSQKKFEISNFCRHSVFDEVNKEILKQEISNCKIWCSNCHREYHEYHENFFEQTDTVVNE